MATSFPTGLDNIAKPVAGVDTHATTGKELSTRLADLIDAVQAVEVKVGINGSAVSASMDYQSRMEYICVALSDEVTAITTGTAKVTIRMPYAMTLLPGNAGVRASLNTASSSGIPTVDINEGGATILSTKLTIDVTEKTSLTAATAVVISDTALADDAEVTFDVDVAGTGAKGLKVWLIGKRA